MTNQEICEKVAGLAYKVWILTNPLDAEELEENVLDYLIEHDLQRLTDYVPDACRGLYEVGTATIRDMTAEEYAARYPEWLD